MSEITHARVVEHLERLKLKRVGERLDAVLNEAARTEPTYLDFLDMVLGQEVDGRRRRRIEMGIKLARFPSVKTLEEFDFKFQPSIDQRLIRELATGRYIASGENVILFGPPGVGKTHLAVALVVPPSRPATQCNSRARWRSSPSCTMLTPPASWRLNCSSSASSSCS